MNTMGVPKDPTKYDEWLRKCQAWRKDPVKAEVVRKKQSESEKGMFSGEKNPFFGKQHSLESRKKMSNSHKGRRNKPHTEETRKKISHALKGKYCGRHLTPEARKKISEWQKAHFSEEYKKKLTEWRKDPLRVEIWRKNLSKSLKGLKYRKPTILKTINRLFKWLDGEYKCRKNPMLGKHLSEEHKRKLSLKKRGIRLTEEHKRKISIALRANPPRGMLGKHHTEEAKIKLRLSTTLNMAKPEIKQKISNALKGRPSPWKGMKASEETRRKMSLVRKGKIFGKRTPEVRKKLSDVRKELWKNPEYREKTIRATRMANAIQPNNAEATLLSILHFLFPNEWKYVGNGEIIVHNKNPDFIDCKCGNKVIELFGDYYHSESYAKKHNRRWESPEERITFFMQHGFNCLIIWEHELKNKEILLEKIKRFNESNNDFKNT